ncbi:Olfactory receptor 10A5 [Merluccius polli]|uniref:Olfactory receptor 10A5 n=1 Tax=Merluccius polli TaxID=89951 RepID=A0AA47NAH1_MERPO|nr:Olfactory receptor 10A5 [Merluccius polli]
MVMFQWGKIYCLYTYAHVEFCNLAVMSYDRYLAICCPLHYKARMTSNKVALLIAVIWLYSFIKFLITLCLNLRLTLCGNVIDRLYCHNYYVVKLACSDTTVNNIYGLFGTFLTVLVPLIPILFSYTKILRIYCLYTYVHVEFCNLAVMSYDRYLAICCPLHYKARMTSNKVALLIAVIWLYSFIKFLITLCLNLRLTLCGNVIGRLFCQNYHVVKLACSDTTVNNIYGLFGTVLTVLVPLIPILFSYTKILRVCLVGSKGTRQKAASTCTPHLASLINFTFGCCFEILQSRFNMTSVPRMLRIFGSLYFLTIQPLFNPIYCLYTYVHVEFCNLAVMSYDRYLAICCPLHYKARMTSNKVALLIAVIWLYSFIKFLITLCLNLRLTLCGNVIGRLFCHNYHVVKLACSDTTVNNIYGLFGTVLTVLVPLIPILFSYTKILRVCLVGSKETRQKALITS